MAEDRPHKRRNFLVLRDGKLKWVSSFGSSDSETDGSRPEVANGHPTSEDSSSDSSKADHDSFRISSMKSNSGSEQNEASQEGQAQLSDEDVRCTPELELFEVTPEIIEGNLAGEEVEEVMQNKPPEEDNEEEDNEEDERD